MGENILHKRRAGQDKQQGREGEREQEADLAEADGAGDAAHEERGEEQDQQAQLLAVALTISARLLSRFQYASLPNSIPISVTWVVRMRDPEILVMVAFCRPMMKQSRGTAAATKPGEGWASQPRIPKPKRSAASSARGMA